MPVNPRFYNNLLIHGREKSFDKHHNKLITASDEALIRRFLNEKMSGEHIGEPRANKLAVTLIQLKRHLKTEYQHLTIDDLYSGIADMKNGVSSKGKPYTANTIRFNVAVLKQFTRWLIENQIVSIPDKKFNAIKLPPADYDTTKAEDLPTYDEIMTIQKACKTPRQLAFISLIYETGCRIGEAARLTWNDLVFDEHGIKVYITDQKTKKKRYSRIIESTAYLAAHKNLTRDNKPENYVFTNQGGYPMTYPAGRQMFDRLIKKSGLKKKITPHDLRRARTTHMIKQNYQESIIKKSIWGNDNTKQFQVYVKLGENDIDEEYFKRAGITNIDKEDKTKWPRTCLRGHVNPHDYEFCFKCGIPLTDKACDDVKILEEQARIARRDPEIIKIMISELQKELEDKK